ncbi:hypothetical protein F5Y08DRAFT_112239 [Xylaria arbuscula]|nr:hypothetical protein F5Y08DRAFT_112239 [Xylaria arbuscula]
MDAGTALAIVQLSASVLKLGRDIAFEFVGPEGAHMKLRHLNTRLQILNTILEEALGLGQPGSSDKLSTTQFPGSESIAKTLRECKSFLEHYKSLLSATPGRGATAQRVLLTVGPDASRIDEFHKKIDQHYAELGQWRMGDLSDRIHELQLSFASVHNSLSVPPTNHPSSYQSPNSGHVTPDIGSYSSTTTIAGVTLDQQLTPATIQTPPVLRPQSRNPSLNSIPELPSPAVPPNTSYANARIRQYSRDTLSSESGHATGDVDRQSYVAGPGGGRTSSSSSSIAPVTGHGVTVFVLPMRCRIISY